MCFKCQYVSCIVSNCVLSLAAITCDALEKNGTAATMPLLVRHVVAGSIGIWTRQFDKADSRFVQVNSERE